MLSTFSAPTAMIARQLEHSRHQTLRCHFSVVVLKIRVNSRMTGEREQVNLANNFQECKCSIWQPGSGNRIGDAYPAPRLLLSTAGSLAEGIYPVNFLCCHLQRKLMAGNISIKPLSVTEYHVGLTPCLLDVRTSGFHGSPTAIRRPERASTIVEHYVSSSTEVEIPDPVSYDRSLTKSLKLLMTSMTSFSQDLYLHPSPCAVLSKA